MTFRSARGDTPLVNMTLQRSILNFLIYEENLIFFFISEGPLSFVLFESPFTSVSTVSRDHPPLLSLWLNSSKPGRFFWEKWSPLPDVPSPIPNNLQKATLIFSQEMPDGLVPIVGFRYRTCIWRKEAWTLQVHGYRYTRNTIRYLQTRAGAVGYFLSSYTAIFKPTGPAGPVS